MCLFVCEFYEFTKGYLKIRPPKTASRTPSPTNHPQQLVGIEEDKVMLNGDNQANSSDNKSHKITIANSSPPMKCTSNGCVASGVSESRKRRVPLDCITNTNGMSLSMTPHRPSSAKRTRQVTLSDILTQKQ